MARASGSRPRVNDPDVMHMKKENRTEVGSKNIVVVMACGKTGNPYGFDKTGLRSTIWPTEVTCPECRALPGVSGPPKVSSAGVS